MYVETWRDRRISVHQLFRGVTCFSNHLIRMVRIVTNYLQCQHGQAHINLVRRLDENNMPPQHQKPAPSRPIAPTPLSLRPIIHPPAQRNPSRGGNSSTSDRRRWYDPGEHGWGGQGWLAPQGSTADVGSYKGAAVGATPPAASAGTSTGANESGDTGCWRRNFTGGGVNGTAIWGNRTLGTDDEQGR